MRASDEKTHFDVCGRLTAGRSGPRHGNLDVIETWVRFPTRMLPETEPGTLTNVVLQYIRQKSGHQ
jgi:hypothetical protein